MKQRVMIAIAIACRPALLIADEPTTALDVTIQDQILSLLSSLRQDSEMSILLITHNLGIVAQFADRVAVMYSGKSWRRQLWSLYLKTQCTHILVVFLIHCQRMTTNQSWSLSQAPYLTRLTFPKVAHFIQDAKTLCPVANNSLRSQMQPKKIPIKSRAGFTRKGERKINDDTD